MSLTGPCHYCKGGRYLSAAHLPQRGEAPPSCLRSCNKATLCHLPKSMSVNPMESLPGSILTGPLPSPESADSSSSLEAKRSLIFNSPHSVIEQTSDCGKCSKLVSSQALQPVCPHSRLCCTDLAGRLTHPNPRAAMLNWATPGIIWGSLNHTEARALPWRA